MVVWSGTRRAAFPYSNVDPYANLHVDSYPHADIDCNATVRFVGRIVSDVDGLTKTLNDVPMRDVRNKAAHDEVVSRDEAGQARA